MGDLKNPSVIIAKGLLFLHLGCLAAGMLLCFAPDLKVAALLAIAIWAFCRFYYFAFYVIERYIDANFRFTGLGSVVVYLIQRRGRKEATTINRKPS